MFQNITTLKGKLGTLNLDKIIQFLDKILIFIIINLQNSFHLLSLF